MAERPDYQRAVALLSAPAQTVELFYFDSSSNLLAGAWERVYIQPAPGTIAEVLAIDFLGLPSTGTAGNHHFDVRIGSTLGPVMLVAQSTWVNQIRFAQGCFQGVFAAGYPQPADETSQVLMAGALVCTETEPLILSVLNNTDAASNITRYYSVLMRITEVS